MNLLCHLNWVWSGMPGHTKTNVRLWVSFILCIICVMKLLSCIWLGIHRSCKFISKFKWLWSSTPKVIKNNKWALSTVAETWSCFFLHLVRQCIHLTIWFNPFIWVWSCFSGHVKSNWQYWICNMSTLNWVIMLISAYG